MLFVVTVVFVITYLPAFLMALKLIPYNVIVFYFYFANNVANPFIYSFMNQVLYTINVKKKFTKDSYRRRSCVSKPAKIPRFIIFVMYCFITAVPVLFY